MFNSDMAIKWISIIILCIIPTTLLYGMDDLEKAYKDQLERYNAEISLNESLLQVQRDGSLTYLKLANEALALGGIRQYNMAMNEYSQTEKKAEELESKINDARNKRQELKIKVLEKYGTLPEWWVEPDMKK